MATEIKHFSTLEYIYIFRGWSEEVENVIISANNYEFSAFFVTTIIYVFNA